MKSSHTTRPLENLTLLYHNCYCHSSFIPERLLFDTTVAGDDQSIMIMLNFEVGCPNFHLLWCIIHGYPKDISRGSILSVKSPLNPNFWTPFPFYSRRDNPFPLTGTGMENCIPKFWEREQESKKHSQLLGTGTGLKNSFPNVGNGNRRPAFPKMVGNGNSRSPLIQLTP